jgi:translation initiation factor IF-3
MAMEAGLDLVEISPNAEPPVAKILDYGKFKYQEQKRRNEARKKQKVIEIKEIKMRPTIDDNDYDVKMRAMRRFLGEGDKVKVTAAARCSIRISGLPSSIACATTSRNPPRSSSIRRWKAVSSPW